MEVGFVEVDIIITFTIFIFTIHTISKCARLSVFDFRRSEWRWANKKSMMVRFDARITSLYFIVFSWNALHWDDGLMWDTKNSHAIETECRRQDNWKECAPFNFDYIQCTFHVCHSKRPTFNCWIRNFFPGLEQLVVLCKLCCLTQFWNHWIEL